MLPIRSYLICATPRSGSTLLCEALENTGIAGYPKEYFDALKATGLPRRPKEYFPKLENPEVMKLLEDRVLLDDAPDTPAVQVASTYVDYLNQVLHKATTANGVFGAKVMWGYFVDFISYLEDIPAFKNLSTPDLLSTIFPHLHYIWVIRCDRVRQAVSLWKAIQTQVWREDVCKSFMNEQVTHQHELQKKDLHFHFGAIDFLIQQIEEHQQAWQRYFNEAAIRPCIVFYEDLAANYEGTALQILSYLNIPIPENLVFAERRMRRQADALSEEWVERYQMLKQEEAVL